MNNSSPLLDLKMLLIEQCIVLWRRKWLALAVCWVVCWVGWAGVLSLPRTYQSTARAFVDVTGLFTPLLRGIVPDTTTAQTSDYFRQSLVSAPNLSEVIDATGLGANRSVAEKEAMVAALARDITVKAQGKNIFTISFAGADPIRAKNIVESLLKTVGERAAAANRMGIENVHSFLDDQVAAYEKQLREADQRRAEFRKQYADYFNDPTSGTPRLQALRREMQTAREAYDSATVMRDSLSEQLKTVAQYRVVQDPGTSPQARIAQARATLAELQTKFTEQHPDVVAARRHLRDLQAQLSSGDSSEGRSQVPNATHEQIRLRLVEAEARLATMKQRLDEATTAYNNLRAASAGIPDVEAMQKDLDRDYDILKKSYDDLARRREATVLSQAADEKTNRTQFVIIDPPSVPLRPSSPNFALMFVLVLFGGIAAGLGLPISLEFARGTFPSTARLRALGLPVIGAVSKVPRPGGRRKAALGAAGATVTIIGLLLTYDFLKSNIPAVLGFR